MLNQLGHIRFLQNINRKTRRIVLGTKRLDELMRPLADAAGVTIAVHGTGRATADPDIVDQVLVGLLGNALKHSPAGGSTEHPSNPARSTIVRITSRSG